MVKVHVAWFRSYSVQATVVALLWTVCVKAESKSNLCDYQLNKCDIACTELYDKKCVQG